MINRPFRILIAAGGTGGHLKPALIIAQALKACSENVIIEFIGAGKPLETKLVDGAGFNRHIISIGGLNNLGIKGLAKWIINLPRALFQTVSLINNFKPDLVIGVGGYVTFLPITVASLKGIPNWIHEAERRYGWANKVLSKYAKRVSLAEPRNDVKGNERFVYTGHPTDPEITNTDFSKEGNSPKNLFIVGGSQGALALDELVIALAPEIKKRGFEVLHQSRPENLQRVEAALKENRIPYRITPFVDHISEAFAWSDIIISRSGAGLARAIRCTRRPAILVPYPSGEEQLENAKMLEVLGQARVIQEGPNFSERILSEIDSLKGKKYLEIVEKLKDYRSPDLDAATKIAEGCLKLIEVHIKDNR